MKVEVEQRIALVTLVLVLLPEPNYLLQDLDVEALALGLRKDVLFLVVHRLETLVDTLDALNERAKPIARNPSGPLMVYSCRPANISARNPGRACLRNEALLDIEPDTQPGPGVTLGRSG